MTALPAVLLALLKGLGILLLAVVALLVLAVFLLPIGLAFSYRDERWTVDAKIGPVHRRLFPRPSAGTAPEPAEGSPGRASAPPPTPGPDAPPGGRRPSPSPGGGDDIDPALAVLRRMFGFLERDPDGFARWLGGYFAAAGKPLLRGMRVAHLDVYWTVTDWFKDAARTATAYGRRITALNTLLAMARDWVRIESDSLRLEPDFTGEQMGRRHIRFELVTTPLVLLAAGVRLARRALHDPVLGLGGKQTKTAAGAPHKTDN